MKNVKRTYLTSLFESKYGETEYVHQYYNKFKHIVEIIDIKKHIQWYVEQ